VGNYRCESEDSARGPWDRGGSRLGRLDVKSILEQYAT
jgi:hypothetical protein